MKDKTNYFQYLLEISSSECTKDATLVIDIKHGNASIIFRDDESKAEFDSALPILENKIDFMKLIKIAGLLGLDVDGDTVSLDLFITVRNSFDFE